MQPVRGQGPQVEVPSELTPSEVASLMNAERLAERLRQDTAPLDSPWRRFRGQEPKIYAIGDKSDLGYSVAIDYRTFKCSIKLGRWGDRTPEDAVARQLASHKTDRIDTLREINNAMDGLSRVTKTITSLSELASTLPSAEPASEVTREVSTDELASMGYLPPDSSGSLPARVTSTGEQAPW